MEEDGEYKRQLALFVRSSTEKSIELVRIGEIIAGLPHRRSFLDIGAGSGALTVPVSQSFDATTAIEPNEQQTRYLRRRCPHLRVINDFWENVDLGEERFDFILSSHVLYYVPEEQWPDTIRKMYDHLEEGGCIAIVIQSPVGEVADFFHSFTAYDVHILTLWSDLIKSYGDEAVSVRYFINDIFADTLEEMVSIGLFLLIDRNFRQCRDDIARYLEARCKTDEGYRIRQDEIVLTVRKPVVMTP